MCVYLRSALPVLCLAAWPTALGAQTPPVDAEISRGIEAVEMGDYDSAILTLDKAVRRLSGDPSRARDLSQACLYLGIAYVGKGHEAAARARFREALDQVKELSLSPEKFPPKVIELFEEAKAEARREASAAPAAPPSAQKKGGGGGKAILIGVGVAAAAGVAVAAGGGGSGGSTSPPITPPAPTTATDVYEGLLNLSESGATVTPPTATEPGVWRAELSWTGEHTEVRMFAVDAETKQGVAETRLLTPNSSVAEWPGQPGRRYELALFLQDGGAAESRYTLRVTHPR